MNNQQDQLTRVSFPHPTKITTTNILEHLHNYQFPITKEEVDRFISNYKPKILENYNELLSDPNFKIEYSEDVLFFGIMTSDHKNGIGVQYKKGKSIYEGNWQESQKSGRGIELFINGSFYEGQYLNGKPDGMGKFQWNNGETYEGQWSLGKKHGSGIWKGSKGDSYIGEWKQGIADGYGVHQWINGDRYEGEFKNCLKEGQGTEKFANGDTYLGQYKKGKPNGIGEYYWANGAVYKGEFNDGLRHGKGVWKRGNGLSDAYDGEYVNDLKCGYGVYSWADGNRYEGQFKSDLREGVGTMYWHDGTFYKGQWKSGIQDGEGMLSMNQEVIKGVFYGTKVIDVFETSNFRNNNTQRHQAYSVEQKSRQTSYGRESDRDKVYSEMNRQIHQMKSTTETSTKVNSFTQTQEFNQTKNRSFNSSAPKKIGQITQSKLLHNLHKPMFPKMETKPLQQKLWRPSGVARNNKLF